MAPSHQTPEFILQKRDLLILHEIGESPACLRRQLAIAFFDGSHEATKKRLQTLLRVGLIEPVDQTRTGRQMLKLTRAGRDLLEANGFEVPATLQTNIPTRLHLHEIMLSSVRAALLAAATEHEGAWIEFSHGPKTAFSVECPEHLALEIVKPDGFVTIGSEKALEEEHFFVEIDRGTETQGRLLHLVRLYSAYRRSGNFVPRPGFWSGKTAFRVLFIFESEERLKNTATNFFRNAGIRTMAWFTTLAAFTETPVGRVWYRPLDFESASVAGHSIFKID